MKNMLALWKIEPAGAVPLVLPDMSSMDAATRRLAAGFYSTFRTFSHRSRVLGLRSHLQRLYAPAQRLGIQPALESRALRSQLAGLLAAFPAQEARLRLVLTTAGTPGEIFVLIEPLQLLPEALYRDGVRVITLQVHRSDPTLKTTSFIAESQAERRRLMRESAFEGLLVKNGRILEGLTSNFFYFQGGRLGTASRGVLNGVTRRQVLSLAQGQGISLVLRALPLSHVDQIDEAFLTSSSRGILPIVGIDEKNVGSGGVGESARSLMRLYDADIESRAEKII